MISDEFVRGVGYVTMIAAAVIVVGYVLALVYVFLRYWVPNWWEATLDIWAMRRYERIKRRG